MPLLISEQNPSIEAIRFQADSKFPDELAVLFAKVQQFAKVYDEKHASVDMEDKILLKHTMIKDLIEGEVGDALKQVIKRHTGLTVKDVIATMPLDRDRLTHLGMYISDSSKYDSVIAAHMANLGTGEKIDKSSNHIEALMNISNSLNKVTGKFVREVDLVCHLTIPVGFFVMKDIITNGGDQYELTPDELTAVLLHEVGHIFAMVEYMSDLAYLGYYGNNILRDVTTQFKANPNTTIQEIITYTEKHIDSVRSKQHQMLLRNANTVLKHIEVMLPKTEIDQKDRSTYNTSWLVGVASTVGKIILLDFAALSSIFLLPIPMAEIANSSLDTTYTHSSREHNSSRNWSMYERLADEYVSRLNMSKHLNTGIIKFNNIMANIRSGKIGVMHNQVIRDSKKIRILVAVIACPCTLLSYLWSLRESGGISNYESDRTRLYRNVANTIDVVKDNTIDKRIRDSILKDIEDMEALLSNRDTKQLVTSLDKVVGTIIRLPDNSIKLGKFIFGSGQLDHDYFQLFEHLDTMLSNKSYYYAAKFASIMGR